MHICPPHYNLLQLVRNKIVSCTHGSPDTVNAALLHIQCMFSSSVNFVLTCEKNPSMIFFVTAIFPFFNRYNSKHEIFIRYSFSQRSKQPQKLLGTFVFITVAGSRKCVILYSGLSICFSTRNINLFVILGGANRS